MKVYVVVFEGAHGLEIDKIFADKEKARRWADKQNAEYYLYHHEIREFSVE